jgi:predicted metal-dependent peptidase
LDFRERSIFEDKEIERLTGKEIVQKYKDDPDMNINTENKASRIYQSALQKLKEKFDC